METKNNDGKLIMMVSMRRVTCKLTGIKRKKTVNQCDANLSLFPSFPLSFYCRVLGVHERGGINNEECLPGVSPWIVCTQKQSKYSSLMRKINRESMMYLIIVLIIFSTIFSEDSIILHMCKH